LKRSLKARRGSSGRPDAADVSRSTVARREKKVHSLRARLSGIRSAIGWLHSNRWAGAKWVHCWQACSSARHLGHWPSPSVNPGEKCAAVGAAEDRSTWKHPGLKRSRRSPELSSPLLFGFAIPALTILSVRHAVALTFGFSLLQSGHVFHLGAECIHAQVPSGFESAEEQLLSNSGLSRSMSCGA
jgi:hypothetical protein